MYHARRRPAVRCDHGSALLLFSNQSPAGQIIGGIRRASVQAQAVKPGQAASMAMRIRGSTSVRLIERTL